MSTAAELLRPLKDRYSGNFFDPARPLSQEQIRELVSYAIEAPSSFNIQHWRFIAVTSPEEKARLKAVAFGQPKVADAAVTFIILGDLKAHEKLTEIYSPLLASGGIDQATHDRIVGIANSFYADKPVAQHDEAIRSASLAAMNLMNAATAFGLISGPMIGFDPVKLKAEFSIPETQLPVMLLAVGYPAPGNFPKKPRLPLEKVLTFR
jgi:nitroreductase